MKIKRFLSIATAAVMVLTALNGMITVSAETDSGSCGDGVIWTWEESTNTLTFSGNGDITNAEEYQKYADITEHIVLESGITRIIATTDPIPGQSSSYGAFYGFNSLKDVQFNDNITEIGEGSFYECPLEGELKFPNSLTYIGVRAFKGTNITSINLDEGMIIGGSAFASCELLKEVTIPKNVTFTATPSTNGNSNKPSTFNNCTKLKKVTIEKGVTELGSGMFLNCQLLENVYIYSSDISTIPRLWFTETVFPICPRNGMSQDPVLIDTLTFHIYKGSKTEQTLREAEYLTDDNTEYLTDFTALNDAIDKADAIDTSKYTDESVSALTKAIEKGKEVLNDLNATQDEVDKAAQTINDALKALKNKNTPTKPDEPSSKQPATNPTTTASNTTRSESEVNKEKSTAKNLMKQAKITKLKAKIKAKKKITVSWKKVKNAKGYQVQVSNKKSFKKVVFNKTLKKNKITVKNKKIKSKKTYYVRVRAYATYEDKYGKPQKVYSKWVKKIRKVKVK